MSCIGETWDIDGDDRMPNKAKSKAQFRFFEGVAHGTIHRKGLSPAKAKEMLGDQSPKGLPARARKRRKKR